MLEKIKALFKEHYEKIRYWKHRKEDKCVFCKKPSEGKYACNLCRKKRAKYYRNYRKMGN